MQFSELQTAVNDNLDANDSTFTNLTAAMTKRWINRAVRWACQGQVIAAGGLISHNFSFLINEVQASTIDEQRKYDLPDGTTATIWEFRKDKNVELVNASSYRATLTKLHKTDIEDDPDFAYLLDKGKPTHFCIEQSKLWLFPLPDHSSNDDQAWTVNMEYYGYLPELSADSDANVFTLKSPELIEWKATALGMEWAKDAQVSYFENKAKEKLIEMITNDQAIDLGGIERGMQPADGAQLGV
ncbi:MAG: phage adaptor protein [Planctomycetota bacterium]|jgi:hypothetical protein